MIKYRLSDLASQIAEKRVRINISGSSFYLPLPLIIGIGIMVMGVSSLRYALAYGKWVTTTHPIYNYSIKYPATWSMTQYGERGSRGSDYLRQRFGKFGMSVFIRTQSIQTTNSPSMSDWDGEIIARQGIYASSEVHDILVGINNKPAQVRIDMARGFLGPISKIKNVLIVTDENIFLLQFRANERNFEEASLIFDEMLASFHLLEE